MLARHGCSCASPRLELAYTQTPPGTPTSYDAVKAKHNSPVFGVYLYEGMQEGRPYYRLDMEKRSTGEFVTRLTPAAVAPEGSATAGRRKRVIWRVDGGPSTTTRLPWNYGAAGGGWGHSTTTAGYYSGGGWATPTTPTTVRPQLPGGTGYGGQQQPQPPISGPGSAGATGTAGGGFIFPKEPAGGGSPTLAPTTITIPIIRESGPIPALVPRYIYWDSASKQWLISTKVCIILYIQVSTIFTGIVVEQGLFKST